MLKLQIPSIQSTTCNLGRVLSTFLKSYKQNTVYFFLENLRFYDFNHNPSVGYLVILVTHFKLKICPKTLKP